MISKYSHKELVWTDLESPKDTEVVYILEEYDIPSTIKDVMSVTRNDDVIKLYNDFIFASFNFPQIDTGKNIENKLVFIACDKYIVTIHNEPIPSLSAFLKEIELGTIENTQMTISDNKLLFAHLLKSLYVNSHKQIIEHDKKIRFLKNQIIRNNRKLKLLTISSIICLIIIIFIFIWL